MSRRKRAYHKCPSCGRNNGSTPHIVICECGLRYMFYRRGISGIGRSDKTMSLVPEGMLPVTTEEAVT